MSEKDGGPAFPQPIFLAGNDNTINIPSTQNGMSLRDYFAAKALQGSLASYAGPECTLPRPELSASEAYKYADAMLKEREK